jgi:hypothetical protein
VILKANTFIDGTWYGPDYGNADLPPEVEAKLGRGDIDAMTMQLRTRLMAAVARFIGSDVIPRFVALSPESQAEALEYADDPTSVLGYIVEDYVAAPAPASDPLDPDERIPLTESSWIERHDINAILDYLRDHGQDLDAVLAAINGAVRRDARAQTVAAPEPAQVLDLGDTEAPTPIEVPEGSVDELLAWVHGGDSGSTPTDGWQDRAKAALDVEKAGESPRKTLVEPLERELAAAAKG